MPEPHKSFDLWRLPVYLLWLTVFFVGLVPERVFTILRETSGVLAQDALVNSPLVITLLTATYLGLFVWLRCLGTGVAPMEAVAKGVQIGVIALAAFLAVPRGTGAEKDISLIGMLYLLPAIPFLSVRWAIIFACSVKLMAWWYLLILLTRYYLFGNDGVFASMFCMFPSSSQEQAAENGMAGSIIRVESASITHNEPDHENSKN